MPPETETPTRPSFKEQMAAAAKSDPNNPANQQGQAPAAVPPVAANAPKTDTPKVEAVTELPTAQNTPKPATETAKTTPDPDEEIIQGKRSPKSEDFKRVKSRASQYEKELNEVKPKLSEYEKELGELRKRPVHNADQIKAIEKERDELKQWRDTIALEWTPEFNAKYQTKITAATAKLKGIVDDATGAKLVNLLTQPDSEWKQKALNEVAENLTPMQLARIGAVDSELVGIMTERQSELARSQESLNKIAQEHQAQKAAQAEARTKVFKSFVDKAKTDNPMFKYKDGDKAWNEAVDERIAIAEAAYNGSLDGEQLADHLMRGTYAHVLAKQSSELAAELAQAKETIAKMTATNPGVGGGARTESGQGPQKGDFLRQMNADMAKFGTGRQI